jgi:DNA-binding NarL/FixJ family response regulator
MKGTDIMKIDLKKLSPRQRDVWLMRYGYGWRMKRIALKMGISRPAVSQLIRRAQKSAGLPSCRFSVIRAKPRRASARSLSDVFNY